MDVGSVSFDKCSPQEVCSFLLQEVPGLDEEVLETFQRHKISGAVFLDVTDEYLRELVPLLGDRIRVKKAVVKALNSAESLATVS